MKTIQCNSEKRKQIKNLLSFLEKNKELIKIYQYTEQFKHNIDDLYTNIRNINYDSIEFDIQENIYINESSNYYYYSKIDINNIQKIAIISKKLDELYFLNICDDINFEIIKYYKVQDDNVAIYKKYRNFKDINESNIYKTLILNQIIENHP